MRREETAKRDEANMVVGEWENWRNWGIRRNKNATESIRSGGEPNARPFRKKTNATNEICDGIYIYAGCFGN